MAHPVSKLFWRGFQVEQMGEDFPRRFNKETVFAALIWKERSGKGERLGFVRNLIARAPVRAPGIERIQDHITARFAVELRLILQRWVIYDGSFPTFPNLGEYLPDRCRLAGP